MGRQKAALMVRIEANAQALADPDDGFMFMSPGCGLAGFECPLSARRKYPGHGARVLFARFALGALRTVTRISGLSLGATVRLAMDARDFRTFDAYAGHQTLLIEDEGVGVIFQRAC